MNELDMSKEIELARAKIGLYKVQNVDTEEWAFITSVKIKNSLVQEYKDNNELTKLQDELILAITKEIKEKLI